MDELEKQIIAVDNMFKKGIITNTLSKLCIHCFRKFMPESELNFVFPLTVIVGKNGSGKTTVMKAIKLLANNKLPQEEFFETAIDDGGLDNADISFIIDGIEVQYKRIRNNVWGKEGQAPKNFHITYIQTKAMVGAIDKSFLYDDIGKSTSRIQKVEYVIKQSKKLVQNSLSVSQRKQQSCLNNEAVEMINYILQENIQSIQIIRHKYFSGTWGTSVVFFDGTQYSEYNSGSGEFVIANMVNQIQHIPSGSLLLLDEPEVSLHPGAQKRLIQYILETIKKKRIQTIITTHSISIIEGLPQCAIKCLRKTENDKIVIEQNVLYQNAFVELEFAPHKKHIIVEDTLAQKILQRILNAERLNNLIKVEFFPGGASNIKKYTVSTYSRTNIDNRYFFLDGDQKQDEIPDFDSIPVSDKTDAYYESLFKSTVGINSNQIDWCVDANRKEGRYNEQQKRQLIISYLEFYKKHVYFLPRMIPEDLIFNEELLKRMYGDENIPTVIEGNNSKQKIKKIADALSQDITIIEENLLFWFIRQKNEDYLAILSAIKEIIKKESE